MVFILKFFIFLKNLQILIKIFIFKNIKKTYENFFYTYLRMPDEHLGF